MTEYQRLTRRGQIRRLRRVAERALSAYDIEPLSLSLLDHAFNTTFAVTDPEHNRYVLHVLRSMDERVLASARQVMVESELWWLDRVRVDLALPAPVPVRTAEGAGVVSVALNSTDPAWLCTLFRWLDGRFVRDRLTPAHLEGVGRMTARLHQHSAHLQGPNWLRPNWFNRPVVGRADADLEDETVRLFTDYVSAEAAGVIATALQSVRRAQDGLGRTPGVFGLIHADIHQRNYLFNRGEVRLIDFGDCGWGHYLYDLAVTLSEVVDSPRLDELRAGLLAGYRQVRELSPQHEAMIDAFILLREVENLSWIVTAREDPNYRAWAAQIDERVTELERRLDGEQM